MNTTTLIEIIKNAPVVQSSLSAVVGAVISTLFLKKNTKTTEFEKIKMGLFKEAVTELLDNGKMTYYEFYKCNNFLKIAQLADKMRDTSRVDEQQSIEYDFDWFVRFFDAVGTISNENMQQLWARILNGEIRQQGSFSFRALETMRNMSQYEAEIFSNITSIILDGTILFSSLEGIGQEINERHGLDNSVLRLLEECGVLNGLRMQNRLELDGGESGGFEHEGRLLLITNMSNETFVLDYTCYNLTRVGIELYPVVHVIQEDNTYLFELGRAIRSKFDMLQVSIYPINRFDAKTESISYDASIDLLI